MKRTEDENSISLGSRIDGTSPMSEQSIRMRIYSNYSAWVGPIDIKNTWINVIELPTVEVGWVGMIKCLCRAFGSEGFRPSYLEKEYEVVVVMLVRRDEIDTAQD